MDIKSLEIKTKTNYNWDAYITYMVILMILM